MKFYMYVVKFKDNKFRMKIKFQNNIQKHI
jgi:hypothetical protein